MNSMDKNEKHLNMDLLNKRILIKKVEDKEVNVGGIIIKEKRIITPIYEVLNISEKVKEENEIKIGDKLIINYKDYLLVGETGSFMITDRESVLAIVTEE